MRMPSGTSYPAKRCRSNNDPLPSVRALHPIGDKIPARTSRKLPLVQIAGCRASPGKVQGARTVIGRACNSTILRPSQAHSISCASASPLLAQCTRSANVRSSVKAASGKSLLAPWGRRDPTRVAVIVSGVTCPDTSLSPNPLTASTMIRSCRPDAGSTVNATPAARGSDAPSAATIAQISTAH